MKMRAERRNARRVVRSSNDANVDDSTHSSRPRQKLRGRERSSRRIFNVDLRVTLGVCVIAFFIILFLIRSITKPVEDSGSKKLGVVAPFPAPKLMDLPQFQGDHRESLYWGTYRPHLYLGIRSRTPKSLIAGLMWLGIKDGRYHLRHMCQDSDGLRTYGWRRHNARDFGHQELVDNDMALATSFLKSKTDGSGFGGDWAVRIDTQMEESKQIEESGRFAHLFFYLADESGNPLRVSRDSLDIHEDSLLASGSRQDIGGWQLHLKSMDDLEVHYSGFRTDHFHNLTELVQGSLAAQAMKYGQLQLSDSTENFPNILVFQISGRIPFKTDVVLITGTDVEPSRIEKRLSSLTGLSLTSQLKEKEREFDEKFEKTFNLSDKLDSDSVLVGKAAIGNMLGGIGYFYGQSIISLTKDLNPTGTDRMISYWPAELYTAVPSRPFFPRGFLWDEGFHQLLIWRWDIKICLDILGHWLDLMNADGWIPREQILGAEALSKVPEEFVPQQPSNGNPPTLFLVLHDIVQRLKKNKFSANESDEISLFLDRAFVRLEAWFQWFNTSQSGTVTGSYYWHGRDNKTTRELNPKTLSSGLDDYPRASHPSGDERHVDLRCWMLLGAKCLSSIAGLFEKKLSLRKDYGATVKLLSDFDILNQMHFDDVYGAYFDFGNHTEMVRLSWKQMTVEHNYARELLRDVLEAPKLRLVPHIGYVSLFPFMGRIIPADSWILEKQLDLISNRSILWTDYGLRSLAKTSTLYMKRNTEHDPPYWRGPIWMNMNYMILSALHHYAEEEGPYKDRARTIYNALRSNLIRNLVQNYHMTGFLWEHYNQKNGKGEGARLFTGWTSLTLLIMAEVFGES